MPNPMIASPGTRAQAAAAVDICSTVAADRDRQGPERQALAAKSRADRAGREQGGEVAHPDGREHDAGEQRAESATLLQVERQHEEERRRHQSRR